MSVVIKLYILKKFSTFEKITRVNEAWRKFLVPVFKNSPATSGINSVTSWENNFVLFLLKMIPNITFLLIFSVFFIVCVPEVFSIKCWVCRSDLDPKCTDPFDNSSFPITDCREEPDLPHLPGVRPTMCRKIRQKVNGEWRYYRSCAYLGEPGIENDERFCLMRTGTYNIFLEYCTCNSKDGCNLGSIMSVNFNLILLSIATGLYGIVYVFVLR